MKSVRDWGCHIAVFIIFWTAVTGSEALGQEPQLEVIRPEAAARPNRPYTVIYEVSWRGGPNDFAVAGPTVESFDWGTAKAVAAEAMTRDGLQVVAYRVEYTAREPGEYRVPAVELSFFDPEAAAPQETPQAETDPPNPGGHPTLRAQPFPLIVRAQRTLPWISGGLGALFVVTAVTSVAVYRLRRRNTPTLTPTASAAEAAAQHIQQARRHRLDGDGYAYFRALARAASFLGDKTLSGQLEQQAQAVGYQGVEPADDSLDGALKDVERRAAEVRRRELSHQPSTEFVQGRH